jgi:alpha-glucosidase (family GH31 glycosyl hydrolase)
MAYQPAKFTSPKAPGTILTATPKYEGGKKYTITMSLDEVPMFVKEGTILPLAKPVEYITPETVFDINCRVYGNAATNLPICLRITATLLITNKTNTTG